MEITRPNQVWAADITYIPMARGFHYLVAIMDWYTRYVVAWDLSNTLDADFCVEALEEALGKGRPEVFNGDSVQSTEHPTGGRWSPNRALVNLGNTAGLSLNNAPILSY
jgi:transposase InsO family protein